MFYSFDIKRNERTCQNAVKSLNASNPQCLLASKFSNRCSVQYFI